MSQVREIEVQLIEPPDEPMRDTSITEGLDELIESISAYGLLQPIGVRDLGGRYRLIWGFRRTLAHREMGKETIMAVVFGSDEEADEEQFMAHENFHRTELDPVEEARFYARLQRIHSISVAEVARRCRRPYARVCRLLEILHGDPDILKAVRDGTISQAQAEELNLVPDEPGRRQMLHYAAANGLSATFIRRWREQRVDAGLDVSLEGVAAALRDHKPPDYRTQARCDFHGDWTDMQKCMPRQICDDCWQLLGTAMDFYQQALQEAQEGGG